MFEFTPTQMISCADKNTSLIEKMQEFLSDSMYALDPDYNVEMHAINESLEKLRIATLKHKYDAEITRVTDLRNSLPD